MAEALGRLDFAKFFSRSFILPLVGMIFLFYLASSGQKGNDLVVPGLFFASFSGIFSLQDAVKMWIEGKK